MYLGSVKFFKHLILTVIMLIIIGLISAVIVLALGINDKSDKINKLNQNNKALQAVIEMNGVKTDYTAEEINELLEALGIDKKELVNILYAGDKEAFGDVITSAPEPPETEPNATTTTPISTTATPTKVTSETENSTETTPLPLNAYEELYPHLYAEPRAQVEYINDENYIYLTFDDGPSKYTENILHYLNKYAIKATFFVIPDNTEASKAYLNSTLDSGHEIGIHTFSHKYEEIYASVEAYLEDFNKAYNLVVEQTGHKPYLFRFPGGSKNDYNENVRDDIISEMTRRGFVYYDWNVDSQDALDANWTQMYSSVLTDIGNVPRAVVLFHDRPGGQNTVLVIEDIIKALIDNPKGYTFSKILPETRPMQF